MTARAPILEMGRQKFFLLDGSNGLEIEVERDEQLRLTSQCRDRLSAALKEWANAHGWQAGQRVWCAIGGRGVSLRRFELPAQAQAAPNMESVLALQLESEFPVPPSELAWGFMPLSAGTSSSSTPVLVGAIKPEALSDLKQVIEGSGAQPIFTIASLARSGLCPPNTPGAYAILHVEKDQSELVTFADQTPESIRLIRWGSADADRLLASELQLTTDAALREFRAESTSSSRRETLRQALHLAFQPLRAQLPPAALGQTLFGSGNLPFRDGIESLVLPEGSIGIRLEPLAHAAGPGRTAATQGIHDWETRYPGTPLLQLQERGSHIPLPTQRPSPLRWGLVALMLLLGLVSLRYVEPLLGKARLSRRLEEIEKQKGVMPKIEQELSFLQAFQRSQPPFLDAVTTLAQSASPGLRLDSLNMNRRGEVSFRGNFPNGGQAAELRLKLIESGFFSSVVVEEQTPTPDRNQVIVRMTAQWRSPEERLAASLKTSSQPKPSAGTPAQPRPTNNPAAATTSADVATNRPPNPKN